MKVTRNFYSFALTLFLLPITSFANEVNVYSYRNPELILPMFDQFTAETGIQVNMVYSEKGMLERLQNEGLNSPADLVFTSDIGHLSDVKQADLTQAVDSDILINNIPERARDSENHWFGLTERARIIAVSKDRLGDLTAIRYEDLADPKYAGKICTRSAKNSYMIGLTASMIGHLSFEKTKAWLMGMKNNLARKPEGNDRSQVKAVSEGVCDIAILNHYYLITMVNDDEQKHWVDAVNIIFPNQEDRGTHMNVSGMAMTKHAPNRENAQKLMEFLTGEVAQKMYAQINGEYALLSSVEPSDFLKSLGDFKRDSLPLETIAQNRSYAYTMSDRVAFDE